MVLLGFQPPPPHFLLALPGVTAVGMRDGLPRQVPLAGEQVQAGAAVLLHTGRAVFVPKFPIGAVTAGFTAPQAVLRVGRKEGQGKKVARETPVPTERGWRFCLSAIPPPG